MDGDSDERMKNDHNITTASASREADKHLITAEPREEKWHYFMLLHKSEESTESVFFPADSSGSQQWSGLVQLRSGAVFILITTSGFTYSHNSEGTQ